MNVATTQTPARRLALVLVFCAAAAVADACRPAVQSVPTPPAGSAPQVLVFSDLAHGFQSNFQKTAPDPSASALEAFTAKTNQFLARERAAAFPGAQILPALANNDTLDAASRAITDYTVHTLTNLSAAGGNAPGVWAKEYAFREAYGGNDLSARTLGELQGTLNADASARANFTRFYDSGSGRAGPTTTTWRAIGCGIGNLDAASFTRCSVSP